MFIKDEPAVTASIPKRKPRATEAKLPDIKPVTLSAPRKAPQVNTREGVWEDDLDTRPPIPKRSESDWALPLKRS